MGPSFIQKWTIISLLEPVEEGFEFLSSDWPLHFTIDGGFTYDHPLQELIDSIEKVAITTKPFYIAAQNEEDWSTDYGSVKVVLLKPIPVLMKFHQEVLETTLRGGANYMNPEHEGAGYIPHCTIQKHIRLKPGERRLVDNITIIDMFPADDAYRRKVVKVFKLDKN